MALMPSLNTPRLDDDDAPRPLSGPGASRQSRRMELRNRGFRGAAVPARKVTPKSLSSSNWSSTSGNVQSSDAENMSPSGTRTNSSIGQRKSSGVLADIGNATLLRPKRTRPRITSTKFVNPKEGRRSGDYEAAFAGSEDVSSPPPPKNVSIRPRSVKVRNTMAAKRRSVSGETRQYIDHLEAELVATQSELSAVTSPSVTRQQSSRMRTLNAETRQLQEALDEWEAKYEDRVQEIVEEHTAVELGLRTQLRNLEEEADENRYRVHELEQQAKSAAQNLNAAEAANIQLEKRLEIISDLLATSAKIDLHAETPGRKRRGVRPKSMLPRFPTTGNLMVSPERMSDAGIPASPAISFADFNADLRESRSHHDLLESSMSHSDYQSDAESVFSNPHHFSESCSTADHMPTSIPHLDMPPPSSNVARGRPMRRMRRFGAGSVGPKPLILPSTSHYGHVPASAPPMDRHDTPPEFPFHHNEDRAEDPSPSIDQITGRRRASTMSDAATLAKLEGSSFLDVPPTESGEDSMARFVSPGSANSHATPRDFSSLESYAGATVNRNLMEELTNARSLDVTDDGTGLEYGSEAEIEETDSQDLTELASDPTGALSPIEEGFSEDSRHASEELLRRRSTTTLGLRSQSPSLSPSTDPSIFARLRALFGDLFRSPVDLARHLIQSAQARLRIPAPLRNVQWWLVGVLLGPMAKRRLLRQSHSRDCPHNARSHASGLLPAPVTAMSPEVTEDMAYGTMCLTPPTSGKRRPGTGMAGAGKKRVSCGKGCGTLGLLGRHSPWLWLKFSITLAFAIGCAFKSGPGSLLKGVACECGDCVAKQRSRSRRLEEGAREI